MEMLASYPFELAYYNNNTVIGKLNDSCWSAECVHVATQGFRMKISRSNTSQRFVIICTSRLVETNGQRQCSSSGMKYIVYGEANVHFPINSPFGYEERSLFRISGSIIILQPSSSSSKETEKKLIVFIDPVTICNNPLLENSKNSPQLSDDFLRLLNNPDTFPDATLKCGADKILVHKNILSVRSPVFAAMFKDEMQEASSGVAEIVDIEPNVLQATLKYVYSGKTDHLDDGMAGDVLFAASKYQLEELKKVCIDKLKSSMTVDNVFRVLVLGDLHDEGLKTEAKEFICKCDSFSNLQKTEGWKLLQSEYPGLVVEVLLFTVNYAQQRLAESNVSK